MTPSSEPVGGFRRLSDLLTGGLPPIGWLAEPVFTTDVLGVIGAPPKCFKSWLLADLVIAVGTGAPWLGMFSVRRIGPVLLVSPEGGLWGLVRRIEAILRPLGRRPTDLDIAFVRTRGLALTDPRDIADLRAACRDVSPVLVGFDSLYAGLEGVRTSQLSEFGAALRSLSDSAAEVGAGVVTTHHLNQAEGTGLHRLTGAGPAEWAGAVLLGSPGPRLVMEGRTTATVRWSLSARDVPEFEFATTFMIGSDNPRDLSSQLDYAVETTLGTGADGPTELPFLQRRVLEALRLLGEPGGALDQIDDVLARSGKPLRHEKLREVLDELVDAGLADGAEGIWWALSTRTVS